MKINGTTEMISNVNDGEVINLFVLKKKDNPDLYNSFKNDFRFSQTSNHCREICPECADKETYRITDEYGKSLIIQFTLYDISFGMSKGE